MKTLLSILISLLCLPGFSQYITLIEDVWPGPTSSLPQYTAVMNDVLYFGASDGVHGKELFSFDGTNVQLAADIRSGGSSSPSFLLSQLGKLYFSADDGIHGREIWVYDGDTAYQAADIASIGGSLPIYLTEYNGVIYFGAKKSDSLGDLGRELMAIDGDSVYLVADINPGSASSDPRYLRVYNNKLYFRAQTDQTGLELYSYNGDSVKLEADIEAGSIGSSPVPQGVFGGELYISAVTAKGRELWKFDGTNASIVADINPGSSGSIPAFLTEFNGSIYFRASTDSMGTELWSFDGSTLNTWDLNPGSGSSEPSWLNVLDNKLYMSLAGCASNYGLTCYPNNFISFDDSIFNNVSDTFQLDEPWVIGKYKNKLILRANDGISGTELWSLESDTPCFIPSNLKTSNLISGGNSSKAGLSWDAGSNALSYIVNGGVEGSDPNTWVTFAFSGTSFTATNLSEVCYVWRVRSVCNSDSSSWSDIDTFCILPCKPPSNLSTIVGNELIFSWDPPVSSKIAYLFEAKINTPGWSGSFKDTITPGTSTTVSYPYIGVGLPSGQYKWRMLTGCSLNPLHVSDYSSEHYFTLPSVTAKAEANGIRISPNPASNKVWIDIETGTIHETFHSRVYSVDGKLIFEVVDRELPIGISTDLFAPGIYVIEVAAGGEMYVEKFVVGR